MSFSVIIPARYASTRLPGKPLIDIAGKPMIAHVVAQAQQSQAHRVIVATDDVQIKTALEGIDCEVCLTRVDHQSGSDRLVEVIEQLALADNEIIVNVQGDEPLIPPRLINEVADHLIQSPDLSMATAAHQITDETTINDPNVVKVTIANNDNALYFSRSVIPYAREQRIAPIWHHIGIYAYRSQFLQKYNQWPASPLELTESLEQLRVLENGYEIAVQKVDYETGIGVDTPNDLAKVRQLLQQ